MPNISTLVSDIENLFERTTNGEAVEVSDDLIEEFGKVVASKLRSALTPRERVRPAKTLYMSEVGKPCHRQTWYSYHTPEAGERLLPHTRIKFLYGDIIEELVLLLARVAGHEVTDEQLPVIVHLPGGWQIRGRMDAKVDGALVDVKSASGFSFDKFVKGLTKETDAFGYISQLYLYHIGDPTHKSGHPMGFLAMNKETGKLHYGELDIVESVGVMDNMVNLIDELEDDKTPPARHFPLVVDKSGNAKLGVGCSYCPFKHECWSDANDGEGLRTFVYSTGPVFLGTVNSEPRVPEITDAIREARASKKEKAAA